MKGNGKPTGDDARLARAVWKLAASRGLVLSLSVPAAELAASLGIPVDGRDGLKARVDAAERHGVASRYIYRGVTRVALSDAGWALAGLKEKEQA